MQQKLSKKFQIKEHFSVLVMNSRENMHAVFEGSRVAFSGTSGLKYDSVIVFTENEQELLKQVKAGDKKRKDNGHLWISYPKKSGSVETDLNRDIIWKALEQIEMEPVRIIAIDADWSSMRVKLKEKRDKPSRFGQDPPGVDRETKTVIPPDDLQKQLDDHPAAKKFFESLAFSHRREYVRWIHDAKKDETRKRRVTQTLKLLLDGRKTK